MIILSNKGQFQFFETFQKQDLFIKDYISVQNNLKPKLSIIQILNTIFYHNRSSERNQEQYAYILFGAHFRSGCFECKYKTPNPSRGTYACLTKATDTSIHMCSVQLVLIGGWTLSLLCMFSLVYGLLHVQLGTLTSAAYASLGHTAWGLGLAWIVVACCTGHGGK